VLSPIFDTRDVEIYIKCELSSILVEQHISQMIHKAETECSLLL
jgi:hypothetical protein